MRRPSGLKEKCGKLAGVEHSWIEYVPKTYTGEIEVPLVISLHGGSRNGIETASRTTWTLVADRENFIVVFPDATRVTRDGKCKKGGWNGFYMFGQENDDLTYLKLLIEEMVAIYRINPRRIYMQGQSNGDQMATHFAIVYGNMLAAAAGTSGPTLSEIMVDKDGKPIRPAIPLPFYRWHGEKDELIGGKGSIQRQDLDEEHKKYWIDCNGCSSLPTLLIEGRYNTEVYTGGEAEFRFTEYVGGDHSLDLSAANIIWKDFFSRFVRGNYSEIITLKQINPKEGNGVALVDGLEHGLINGGKVKIHADTLAVYEQGGDFFVPLGFINKAFGVDVQWESVNERVTLTYGDKEGVLMIDEPLIIINQDNLYQVDIGPQMLQEEIMIPMIPVAKHILNKNVSVSGKAIYISNKDDYIDHYTERILTQILQ